MAVRSIYGLGIRFPFSTIISDSGALPGCSQALFSESLWLGSVKLCPGFVRYLVRVCNLLFPLFQTLGCVQVLLSLASVLSSSETLCPVFDKLCTGSPLLSPSFCLIGELK